MSVFKYSFLRKTALVGVLVLAAEAVSAQNAGNASDDQLLNQYVHSKGPGIITFDASNIKQFWVEKNVVSMDNDIRIIPAAHGISVESDPLKIQLANVNETQDCKIEVIAETKNVKFQILNNKSEVLSSSRKEDDFMGYSITSSVFHMEDVPNYSFAFKFISDSEDAISIKKIILSFSNNKGSSFLVSPGEVIFTGDMINTTAKVSKESDNSFSVTGTRSSVFSAKKFFVADNTLSSSVTIKNAGVNPITVYVGYAVYGKDQKILYGSSFPYQKNEAVSVVSAPKGGSTIVVDSYSEWRKGCFVALNAKDDLSDLPNNTFLDGRVVEIKKLDDGQAEIVLDKPLSSELKQGARIRVHGLSGSYFYTRTKKMEPGEEEVFASTVKKDDSLLEYTPKAFPKGTYYVVPIILSYSADPKVENTILIRDYSVSY